MNTHITVIVDESSSMNSRQDEVKDGFADMLTTQKAEPGNATISIVKFSTIVQEPVLECEDIKNVHPLAMSSYRPNGMTALYDAIGFCITELDSKISLKEVTPDNVLFVVITDGYENCSREFNTSEEIQKLVNEKKDIGWDFMFIGADEDALAGAAQSAGFSAQHTVANNYCTKGATYETFSSLSRTVSSYRTGQSLDVSLNPDRDLKAEALLDKILGDTNETDSKDTDKILGD